MPAFFMPCLGDIMVASDNAPVGGGWDGGIPSIGARPYPMLFDPLGVVDALKGEEGLQRKD